MNIILDDAPKTNIPIEIKRLLLPLTMFILIPTIIYIK